MCFNRSASVGLCPSSLSIITTYSTASSRFTYAISNIVCHHSRTDITERRWYDNCPNVKLSKANYCVIQSLYLFLAVSWLFHMTHRRFLKLLKMQLGHVILQLFSFHCKLQLPLLLRLLIDFKLKEYLQSHTNLYYLRF